MSYLRGHEQTKAGKALRALVMGILDSSERLRETAKEHPIIGGEEEDRPLVDEEKDAGRA